MKDKKEDVRVIRDRLDRVLQLLSRLLSYEKEYEDEYVIVNAKYASDKIGDSDMSVVLADTIVKLKMSEGDEVVFGAQYGKVIEFRPGEWITYLEEILEYEIPLEECIPINDVELFNEEE